MKNSVRIGARTFHLLNFHYTPSDNHLLHRFKNPYYVEWNYAESNQNVGLFAYSRHIRLKPIWTTGELENLFREELRWDGNNFGRIGWRRKLVEKGKDRIRRMQTVSNIHEIYHVRDREGSTLSFSLPSNLRI